MSSISDVVEVLVRSADVQPATTRESLGEIVGAFLKLPTGVITLSMLAAGAPMSVIEKLGCVPELSLVLATTQLVAVQERLNKVEAEMDVLREQLVELRSANQVDLGAL